MLNCAGAHLPDLWVTPHGHLGLNLIEAQDRQVLVARERAGVDQTTLGGRGSPARETRTNQSPGAPRRADRCFRCQPILNSAETRSITVEWLPKAPML